MSMSYEEVLAAALSLDAEQRADLADLLWITIDRTEDVAKAWLAEAERRGDGLESHEEQGFSAEEVLAELRAKYARSRTEK